MRLKVTLAIACLALAPSVFAVTNLATNPGFEDLDLLDGPGDGWGSFGAAGFNSFFGPNGHGSLFPDTAGNSGGFFQTGIPAEAGKTYQFDLLNTRIEASYDAVTQFGLEFYAADDETLLGESFAVINAAERLALTNVDPGGSANAAVFSHKGTAPVGASIVRPVVKYDAVNFAYLQQSQSSVFVFDSFLSEFPAAGGNLLKNPGFGEDVNQDGSFGDVWGFFGNAETNDFFDGNVHASFFADTAGNSGGFFQQSILAEDGTTYEFELTDVRIESAFDARLQFGLEYYAGDDFTLLGTDLVEADTTTTGDGLSFRMTATPADGTVFVRPVVLFDEVNFAYLQQPNAAAFVFDTSLAELVSLPGDYNSDGRVDAADYTVWRDGGSPDSTPAGYALWADNYGSGSGAATSIPEPTSMVLLLAALAAATRRRG